MDVEFVGDADDIEIYEVPGHGEEIETTLTSTTVLQAKSVPVTEQSTVNEFDYAGMGWTKGEAEELMSVTSEQIQGMEGEQHTEFGEASSFEIPVVETETVD
ncbi:hypothetical protein [Enteractinococcus coprophilus]|uniref:Uncharacterized protein n=1 Tax=Enteractinococcus coprophilus TaxID=1027633 RepID=A0A543AP45_9MICC|nr:hypothetical protein FB556_0810 [Enteractinococcus coprophilus]